MKSKTQNTLIIVGWILLIIMLLPSIIMSSLGISNLNKFHSNRNNYLYQEYNNITIEIANNYTNSSSNEVTSAISTLEQLLLQIQFATNNSGSTSMVQEGIVRWQISFEDFYGPGFDNWPESVPNSTYRAYTTVLYGINYYVIALDPLLNNLPLKSYPNFVFSPPLPPIQRLFIMGIFDKRLFLDTDFPYKFVNTASGEIRPFVVNTSRCDECWFPAIVEPRARLRFSNSFFIDEDIFVSDTPVPWPDVNFTLRPVTQFLFFK